MRRIISPTTAGASSLEFRINEGSIVAFVAKGLAGAETAKIQISNADGTYSDVPETGAVMTATAYTATISAAGNYIVVLSATAGLASVAMGI